MGELYGLWLIYLNKAVETMTMKSILGNLKAL